MKKELIFIILIMKALDNNIQNKCILCSTTNSVISVNKNYICEKCLEEQIRYDKLYTDKYKTNFNPDCSEIIKSKLYLGNYDFAKDINLLLQVGITHILVVGKELECFYQDKFEYMKIRICDYEEEDIKPYLEKSVNFIENGNIVFVHCNAGVSRSPAIVIAYLILKQNLSYLDSYSLVKQKRPIIHPNDTFKKVLENL